MTGTAGRARAFDDLVANGGRAGADIAAVDWAAGPLGPPRTWPASLVGALRLVLGSRFSMWLAWGPQLTFFCNDAYRRGHLGRKYPWALGRPASAVWAEIWPDIGPRIDHVVSTGEATWDEALLLLLERSGYVEETYHTFSYSPIAGDDGQIAGLLCVVNEDTLRVIAERRIGVLRELGAALLGRRTERGVLRAASAVLGGQTRSLPFTATYLFDRSAGVARLAARSGIPARHPLTPARLRLGEPGGWPVADLAAGRAVTVTGLPGRFAALPHGAWPDPPRTARLVPLRAGSDRVPYGFFLAGLNPYRPPDADYLTFVDLVAGQLAAVLVAARGYQAERRRARALAELDQAKTAFFTNVSHEFRTPLTLLLAPLDDALADLDAPLPPGQQARLEIVRRNAQRLLKLVNALLDFSRAESGTGAARPRPVDLAALTSRVAEAFRSAVQRAGLTLEVDAPALPYPVRADPEMWTKIVSNLVSNALKFTFEGGIRVTLRERAGQVELAVADTGVGIDEADQARLFERFHRVAGARSRSHEGAGIGLALVAQLAALHGGTAGVRSVAGQGSTFTVRLPAKRGSMPGEQPDVAELVGPYVAESETWHDEPPPPPGTGGEQRPRVLVVDDNADMRRYIRGRLTDFCMVTTARDGKQALDLALAEPPDLVLTDVMMPVIDGLELLARLRTDPRTRDVPVVVVSARAGEDAAVEGLDAGANDYLVKPFSARELRARVRANLELDRVRRLVAELRASEARLDHAQHLAGVASWEYDLRTGSVTGSGELFRQLGLPPGALAGADVAALIMSRVHPDDRHAAAAALRALAERGTPVDVSVRVPRADGSQRSYRVIGEVAGATRLRGSSQDVTDRLRAEQAVADAASARQVAAREHEVAEQLQRGLLPETTFDLDALRAAAFYRSSGTGAHVGGDWYDVIDLGAGRTALVIGDVMGHGVRAAATMGRLRATAAAYARLDLPPEEVLSLMDDAVEERGDAGIATCLYGVYDPGERTFSYANAGHPPPLLRYPDGRVQRLSGVTAPPLGSGSPAERSERLPLPPGGTLLLYTDGLVERRDRPVDAGIDELARELAGAPDDVAALPGRLAARLLPAGLPAGAGDDVAILAAQVPADRAGARAVTIAVEPDTAALPGVRDRLARLLERWALPAPAVADGLLVVDELVTNAIRHGAPPVQLRVRRAGTRLVVEVGDRGPGLPRRLAPARDDPHGRGLQIVAALASRWGVRRSVDGKYVWCVLDTAR